MESILSPDEFDISKITYGEPKDIGTTGFRMVYMSHNKSPITVQTPEMIGAYSMKDYEGNHNYTLDLSFKGKESRSNLNTFFTKLVELDDKLINDGIKNGLTWIRKPVKSKEVAESLYTKMIRYSKDKTTGEITDKFPPTLKIKVPYKEGKFVCEAYNGNKELIDIGTVETKGARITAIIQCLGIWVAGGKYGVSWKILQMKILPAATIKGYAFKEDTERVKEDDLDVQEEDPDMDELAHVIKTNLNIDQEKELVESSEEEEEEEDDIEPTPPPAKASGSRGKKK
jgi:hypothetical protein